MTTPPRDRPVDILERAEEFLCAARTERHQQRCAVAFDAARMAAELAGKAMLVLVTGAYPRRHDIGGTLAQAGLLPRTVAPRRLSRFLAASGYGAYGLLDDLSRKALQEALGLATALVAEARRRIGSMT